MIALCFLFVLLAGAISIIWTTFRVGISPMPTSKRVRKDLEGMLPPIGDGKIFELGSGFGHLALFLSFRFSSLTVFAYELSLVPYLCSLFFKRVLQRKNLFIQRKDFFEVPLHGASLVVCYLFPKAMERLKEKLIRELPKGAFVLSHTFAFRGWKPIKMIESKDLGRTRIYLYRM